MASTTSTELRDSCHLADDPEALRARIAEDGYVFARGLLDADAVRAVGRVGLGHLQDAGWIAPGPDPFTATPLPPVRAVRMRHAFGLPGYREIAGDPSFHRLAFSAPLSGLLRQLMGPEAFCYPLKIPRVVYPVSMVPQQPGGFVHKDYGAVQDMFTCWVPLGDVPHSLGGLAIEPGSQHRGRVRPEPVDRLPRGWLTTDYEAGDVLVFHCLTTHAALPNREPRMRFSGEYRWQRSDQLAPRRLVLGPWGGELGARRFRGNGWWHPVPRDLSLVDADPLSARYPVPPSRFVRLDEPAADRIV